MLDHLGIDEKRVQIEHQLTTHRSTCETLRLDLRTTGSHCRELAYRSIDSIEEHRREKVLGIYGNANRHWVGDGFPVRSLFSYNTLGQHISPFLLLDYAGPADFPPHSSAAA